MYFLCLFLEMGKRMSWLDSVAMISNVFFLCLFLCFLCFLFLFYVFLCLFFGNGKKNVLVGLCCNDFQCIFLMSFFYVFMFFISFLCIFMSFFWKWKKECLGWTLLQ